MAGCAAAAAAAAAVARVSLACVCLCLCIRLSTGMVLPFAGYKWQVRNNSAPGGPGPNVFSSDNVHVDDSGRLVLSLRRAQASHSTTGSHNSTAGQHKSSGPLQPVLKKEPTYTCAEVWLGQALGHGTYSFHVDRDVSALGHANAHIVLGMFLYKDDTHEIDIEVARWGNADPHANNGDFVVQPPTQETARYWRMPSTARASFHFTYTPTHVVFDVRDAADQSIMRWNCTDSSRIPSPDGMLVHINLWLFRGTAHGLSQDVVPVPFSNFTFHPLTQRPALV